jgi:surface polysaccharide O-acyltransferase-like enzyme
MWAIPIFAMITGYFFLRPEKELPLKKLYGKYILRLLLALVFWTIFYAAFLDFPFYPFTGKEFNFWYVAVCIGLYISMPVLRCIASDDRLLAYSCWLWLFIRIYCNIEMFVVVPFEVTDFVFTEYIGYCLWGYYLTRIKWNPKQTHLVYFGGVAYIIINTLFALITKGETRVAFDNMDPFFLCVAILLFVHNHPIHLRPSLERLVTYSSGLVFGIYMVQTFVDMEIFTRIHRFIPNVFALVPIAFVALFAISYVIILIIKQIPVLKKWVV